MKVEVIDDVWRKVALTAEFTTEDLVATYAFIARLDQAVNNILNNVFPPEDMINILKDASGLIKRVIDPYDFRNDCEVTK